MPTIKPYSGNSRDRLVKLINDDNGTNYQYGVEYTFGTPSPATGTGGRNTKIRLIPTDSTQYGQQDISYWRLPLSVLDQLPAGEIDKVKIDALPFKIHDVLDRINEALGIDLAPEEVLNTEYTLPQEKYQLRIASASSSLAWSYSTYNFAVEADFLNFRYTTDGQIRRTTDGQPRMIAE